MQAVISPAAWRAQLDESVHVRRTDATSYLPANRSCTWRSLGTCSENWSVVSLSLFLSRIRSENIHYGRATRCEKAVPAKKPRNGAA